MDTALALAKPDDVVYKATPTGSKFHKSDDFVRLIMGPIGSGKSVACCWEIFRKACAQKPFKGVRLSRWVVVRNTYRELVDTTINTYNDWFSDIGYWVKMDMKHVVTLPLDDGTTVQYEVLFRALDKPQDIKKLLSLELTGGFLNEAREIPKAVLDMLIGRVGRYPGPMQGGASWWGVIMDTNPPDSDHWIYELFEENLPDEFSIFHQPSGTSDEAENVHNLPERYYERMSHGKDPEWIKVYVHGKYGFVQEGEPVYPEYNDEIHYCPHKIDVPEGIEIEVGIDFGLTPAALIGFQLNDQWVMVDEVVSKRMGALQFGEVLGKHLRREYRGHPLNITGDPAGEQSAQTDERTPFDILNALGIEAVPAHTNDVTIRRETFARPLTRMTMTGEPGMIIGPKCKMLRKGLSGGFKYRRLMVSGADRYVDKPDKNIYSHICEAGQYLMLGAGEDNQIIGLEGAAWNDPLEYNDKGVI